MANICWNSLDIRGERVSEVVEILKPHFTSKEQFLFTLLVGVNTELDAIDNWGCKDVPMSVVHLEENEDGSVNISFDSKWSPPTKFVEKLSVSFGLLSVMTYSESGADFYGTQTVQPNGDNIEVDYEYRQGMFIFDNEGYWVDIFEMLETPK